MIAPERDGGYSVPARIGGTWQNVGPFEWLDVEALDALDGNLSRHFDVAGVLSRWSVVRTERGARWPGTASRNRVLAGLRSAPRARVVDE